MPLASRFAVWFVVGSDLKSVSVPGLWTGGCGAVGVWVWGMIALGIRSRMPVRSQACVVAARLLSGGAAGVCVWGGPIW